MDATTVAVDLAKTVFELALANAQWRVVSRQRLNRSGFARFLANTGPLHGLLGERLAHILLISIRKVFNHLRGCHPVGDRLTTWATEMRRRGSTPAQRGRRDPA